MTEPPLGRPLHRRALLAAGLTAVPALGVGRLLGAAPSTAPSAAHPRAVPRGRDYVVEGGAALLRRDGRSVVVPDVSLRVRDDRIVELREGRVTGGVTRVDARGCLLLPGFISGHTHAASGTPTRGLIEGGRSYQRPLELLEALPDDALDAITAYNVAELLRSGCTTHVEMSLSLRQAQSYVRVARRWHVRGYPGGMIPGTARLFPVWRRTDDTVLERSVPETLREIEANLAFALEVNGAEEGLIRPMMTPHATDTHTPETMAAVVAAARRLGNGIHIHLAQGAGETRTTQRLRGMSPAVWMASLGAFDGPLFGAHMSGATAEDWAVMARYGGIYAHCPSGGGAGNATGMQPYPEALAAGVHVNVGIDTHSNDYVENLKLAVLAGRARARLLNAATGSRLPQPTIAQAVDGATVIAADGLRRPDLGRLEVGALADWCAIDLSGPLVGAGRIGPEPLHHLLYANGLSVRHVATQGHLQVVDGQLAVDEEARVVAAGGAAVAELWAQLRAERWFDAP